MLCEKCSFANPPKNVLMERRDVSWYKVEYVCPDCGYVLTIDDSKYFDLT